MLEKELRANWDSVFYPKPEPEVETFGEEVEPVGEPVLLAAGPSGTMTDGGAAFGVFPQMKPRRAGASEVGANLPMLAADVAAGGGKGLISGGVGLAGDVLAIGRGLYEIGRRGGDQSAVDAFMSGMEKGFILPTSDDVDKWLTQNIGPVVPPGGPIQGAREAAAGAGRLAGELVADPVLAVKGAKAAVKGAKVAGKALAPKAGEMLDAYMQRTGMQQNLMAYHGTPHTVDKFDAAKIGTGEGAQAYGYGLYFAESKDVARGYRNKLNDPIIDSIKADLYEIAGDQQWSIKAFDEKGNLIPKAKGYLAPDEIQKHYGKEVADLVLSSKYGGNFKNLGIQEGFLYTVDIPDAMIAKMLDFDAPISSQSQEIQALARQYNIQPEDLGGDLLVAVDGKRPAGAKLLQEAGIPGVRYLDQGSRGDGKGTRNLVVFPGGEDQVKIIKSEGQGK